MARPGQIKKKAVLSVCSEEEIETITVCPMWGIRAKVAVGKIDPYFYQKVGSKAPSSVAGFVLPF